VVTGATIVVGNEVGTTDVGTAGAALVLVLTGTGLGAGAVVGTALLGLDGLTARVP
jgi:hypothetical protein